MFDWFDKTFRRREYLTDQRSDLEKIGADMSKVIPFPEFKAAPSMLEVKESKNEAGKTAYSLGLTDNNRVSLTMGYTVVTMNALGVQQLIDQLELFKRQIEDNGDDTSKPANN